MPKAWDIGSTLIVGRLSVSGNDDEELSFGERCLIVVLEHGGEDSRQRCVAVRRLHEMRRQVFGRAHAVCSRSVQEVDVCAAARVEYVRYFDADLREVLELVPSFRLFYEEIFEKRNFIRIRLLYIY